MWAEAVVVVVFCRHCLPLTALLVKAVILYSDFHQSNLSDSMSSRLDVLWRCARSCDVSQSAYLLTQHVAQACCVINSADPYSQRTCHREKAMVYLPQQNRLSCAQGNNDGTESSVDVWRKEAAWLLNIAYGRRNIGFGPGLANDPNRVVITCTSLQSEVRKHHLTSAKLLTGCLIHFNLVTTAIRGLSSPPDSSAQPPTLTPPISALPPSLPGHRV